MMSVDCRESVASENVYDYIINLEATEQNLDVIRRYPCYQLIDSQAIIVYADAGYTLITARYSDIPKCYGLMNIETLVASGIYQVQTYPGLNLNGNGVLMGFLDTGIDYTNPAFRNSDGSTRIFSIWDQTADRGPVPEGFLFGREYSREQIDEALRSEDSYNLVPVRDTNGHGSALAAIAAGSIDRQNQFSGAAPEAELIVVKLKEAKQNLRAFWGIPQNAVAYSEADIMSAIWYLHQKALAEFRPLVICIGLGTNQGDHSGGSRLGNLISRLNRLRWRAVTVAIGNEGNERHHYFERMEEGAEFSEVELRVGDGEEDLTVEIWGTLPNVYSLSVISPSGEQIPRVSAVPGIENRFRLLFDQTTVLIDYQISEGRSGTSLILVRLLGVAQGIWKLRVYPSQEFNRTFHIWLPIRSFLRGETYFLEPDPNVTLTEPSAARQAISVGAYYTDNNSIAVFSGRGYNADDDVKPDFVAPGVDVQTVLSGRTDTGGEVRYGARSGTGIAAAVTAGAIALLFEWAAVRNNYPTVTGVTIQSFLIRGAARSIERQYPNQEWGYGRLDLYGAFEELQIR